MVKELPNWRSSPFDNTNPIIDTGAPTSTGGIEQATKLCQALGIEFQLSPPRTVYHHGWGSQCEKAKRIRNTWYLTIFDVNGLPTTMPFDLIQGSSPLIVGMDIVKYANAKNIESKAFIEFKRPTGNQARKLFTYIQPDGNNDDRLWLEIIPQKGSSVTSLMANIRKKPELNVVKKSSQIHTREQK